MVEALGIEPRSEKELHPASTCLAQLSILKVKSPMGRTFTSSLRFCFVNLCLKHQQLTNPSSRRLIKTQRVRFLETSQLYLGCECINWFGTYTCSASFTS